MVSLQEVERQLKKLDVSFRFWGRAEMLELQHILIPGEQIRACLNGRYEGGFAMLCATDQRLLLIDKKPMYLTLEDIRYDMVAEVDFSHRLMDATITVCTPNKTLRFTSWRRPELRKMTSYLQQRVMEIRQQHVFEAQVEQQFLRQNQMEKRQKLQPIIARAAVPAAQSASELPMPGFMNTYYKNPLIMRRRVSKWGR